MYFLYILYSSKCDRYYIGSTENVALRLIRHNAGSVTATQRCTPWVSKYIETFDTRAEAMARELELKKKKSRTYLEWLISRQRGGAGSHAPI